MKLSIYVGLRAIAWILTEGSDIIKHGIKRVNISFDNYYEYIAGLPVSKRINRRMKKQMRRNLWRRRSRKKQLEKFLSRMGERLKLHRNELLQLRVQALERPLTNDEFVTVILDLMRKRGYKSQRGVNDNENSDYLQAIAQHETNLSQYRSIAEYLLSMESYRNVIFTRESYVAEFEKIMEAQKVVPETRKKLRYLLYYQRPLRKGKVGKCRYEKNREVTHGSHPLYQELRVWRDVMNIELYDREMNEIEIDNEQRKRWADRLMRGQDLTKAACAKDLGFKTSAGLTWYSGKVIPGHPLWKVLGELNIKNLGSHTLEELWRDMHSAKDDAQLNHLLEWKYKFLPAERMVLVDLDLSKLGYAELSTKAVRKLLPQLKAYKTLKEALIDTYGETDFENVALRNVVLEQHYASYAALVKAVRAKFDIKEVNVELDSLLKLGNKGRKALAQNKRKDDKERKKYEQYSDYELKKIQLWEESGKRSPYEPEKEVSLEELLTDAYNLDHVVPKSKLFERSNMNQVICPTHLNEQKGRMTGMEFAEKLGITEAYLQLAEQLPEGKKALMLMRTDDIPTDWISRRVNSDYNTKCFVALTKDLPTLNVPNKLINRYSREWYGSLYNEQDARYFLMKALTIANMSQETIGYFDNLKTNSEGVSSAGVYALLPALNVVDDLSKTPVFMPRIKYSRKTPFGYTPRFALHQETIFGRREVNRRNAKGEIVTEYFYKVRQPVSKLSPAMVRKIMDKAIRELIEQRIAEKGSHEAGIESLSEEPVLHNGKPVMRVSVMQSGEKLIALRSKGPNGKIAPKGTYAEPVDFVYSEKNRYLRFYVDENGKVQKQTEALVHWIDQLNGMVRPVNIFDLGIELQENDIVELHGQRWYVIGASESLTLRPVYCLSATETYKLKAEDYKELKKLKVNQLGELINAMQIGNTKVGIMQKKTFDFTEYGKPTAEAEAKLK